MTKPILFNTDMVRAILDNHKSVTRRVVKLQPEITPIPTFGGSYRVNMEKNLFIKPPYRPGDILYVRETWQHGFGGTYLYRASAGLDLFMNADGKLVSDIPWRPSIHMPREAARLFLRVTDVRVERLWQIIGTTDLQRDFGFTPEAIAVIGAEPLARELWDSTIKKADRDIYGWAANPWVWVIEFEQCEKPEDPAP